MSRVKIDAALYERVKKVSETAGFASSDEFIIHAIEKELAVLESADSDKDVTERLRGLGYLE